jgi:hypothetical protein
MRSDRPLPAFGRRLVCCRCGAHEWVELSLGELDRQRADPALFDDWTCDRCVDREALEVSCGDWD